MPDLRYYVKFALLTAAITLGVLLVARAGEKVPLTAAQLGQALPPKTVFIVMQCDELVVAWAILQDGSAFRGDPEHAPPADQYAAYLNWLNSAGQIDLYKLPCVSK